jgi:hypothetical protein
VVFAYFQSTDSESRQDFLEVLRGAHTDSTINDLAVAYWQQQELAQAVIERLTAGAPWWADEVAWQASLTTQQVTDRRHVRIATEGALPGSSIAHGVSPELTVLSDGAGQFDVFVHALCRLHGERPLARPVPHSEKHRQAIELIRRGIRELDAGLKAYREAPEPMACEAPGKQFDDLVAQRTDYRSIDGVLKGRATERAKSLRVLERPEVPLHNNLSEGHIRDDVKERKIGGSTRGELGRRARDTFASSKETCRRLGVNFWEYLQDRVRGLQNLVSARPWPSAASPQASSALRMQRGVSIATEQKTTNLVRRPGFPASELLKTRLGSLESRRPIREWLSRT